ncbi:hypothetical protein HNY73_007271 [Argiope bruennichi]|uniref:Uncharacterized protein n=1 Tax=Argiope bruennichi TaxID=94029 RepID=A0A8T0FIZ7_ARGBR|nr:hypothetical protein HNY73_007271 [Argiope bruennichi]
MEEELQAQSARKNKVDEFSQELEGLSEHYQNKLELQERITTWCNDLMDDLLLIDFEDLETSRYRRPVHEIRTAIEDSWHKIEVCYGNITRDVQWLRNTIESVQPDLVELWWLMAEDIKKRFVYIRELFLRFFEVYAEFKELVHNYSETFKDDPHFIFERYRNFS